MTYMKNIHFIYHEVIEMKHRDIELVGDRE